MITSELRQAFGDYYALKIENNLRQNEAAQNILNILGKPYTEHEDQPKYDMKKIEWSNETGPRGDYQKAVEQDSEDFRALLNDLEAHEGKLQRNGYFIWLFSNAKTVGRKKAKQ